VGGAVELELPADRSFDAVGRQVVAGLGTRIGLTIDQTEDLERALEAVFAQPAAGSTRKVTVTQTSEGLHVSAGPVIAGPEERRGLERVLSTLVDELVLDESDQDVWISMRLSCGPLATASR
jgi:hypothetical protein